MMMQATLLNPNQLSQCFTEFPIRAREHQIRAILGASSRAPYCENCTVNSYNGYIATVNLITRHARSLTCMLKRMCANQHTLEHAETQPLHGLNMAKSHIFGPCKGCVAACSRVC